MSFVLAKVDFEYVSHVLGWRPRGRPTKICRGRRILLAPSIRFPAAQRSAISTQEINAW